MTQRVIKLDEAIDRARDQLANKPHLQPKFDQLVAQQVVVRQGLDDFFVSATEKFTAALMNIRKDNQAQSLEEHPLYPTVAGRFREFARSIAPFLDLEQFDSVAQRVFGAGKEVDVELDA
eukprot:GABV01014920.1.p1 GENE.GABV01014920.1~~GABV01014920.1.p1  ORF type:complete len:120 (-),score=42.11 GABV01014920.1:3-362(-)